MQINEMQLIIRYIYFYIIKHAMNEMEYNGWWSRIKLCLEYRYYQEYITDLRGVVQCGG